MLPVKWHTGCSSCYVVAVTVRSWSSRVRLEQDFAGATAMRQCEDSLPADVENGSLTTPYLVIKYSV